MIDHDSHDSLGDRPAGEASHLTDANGIHETAPADVHPDWRTVAP
jgi:hypothetical protein